MTKWPVWLRRAAGFVVTVLLLYSTLWIAVPPLLKWQAEKKATLALGRDLRIGRVAFVPWKLDLVFDDVRIAPVPAAAPTAPPSTTSATAAPSPLLTIGRLHVDFAWASFWKLAPVVQALELDALRIHVSRLAPGHYDIDDLIRRFSPTKPDTAPSEPVHFALYNVQLRDAAIEFDDRPAARVHAITALHLAIPWLSNLPAQVDIKVEPRLSFLLNGVPFDTGALATPFAKTRSGEIRLKVAGLDVAPYLGYLPDSLPARIQAGTLTTDLAIDFALPPGSPPTLALHGSLAAADTRLIDREGAPLLAWRRLDLELRSVSPLARQVALSSLRIEGARLVVRRDANGRINLLPAGAGTADPPKSTGAGASAPTSAVPAAWRVELDRFALVDAAVTWHDAAIVPAASLQVDGLALDATAIEYPLVEPLAVNVRGSIRSETGPAAASGTFRVAGSTSARQTRLTLSLSALPLETLGAYLAQSLTLQVDGRLSAQARLVWSATPGSGPLVTLDTATLDGLTLRDRGTQASPGPVASSTRLELADTRIDVAAREVTVGRLAVVAPSLSIARDRDGRFDVARWPVAAATPSIRSPPNAAPAPTAWRVLLRDAVLAGGRFEFADARAAGATAADPLRIAVDGLRVAVQNLAWQGDRPTVPAQIEASGRIGPPHPPGENASRGAGAFDWRGVVGVAPLLATGSLRLERIPVHLFMPYVGHPLGLRLARAELGYAGNVSVKQLPAGLDLDAGADLLLGAVRIENAAPGAAGETLASWNTLGLKSVRVSMKPGAKPQIDIAQAALDDFYTRLVVTPDGKLNLSSFAASTTAEAPAVASPEAKAPASGLPVDIRLDATALTHGRIDFSDHFVHPNYSTSLTELTGRLGPLRSDRPELAALSLHGKAAGTALLDISGAVNPLVRPLALDLHAKATDLELAPLSPYAGKYAGYAIERGKLSMDVSYRLDADGHLDAKNQVVLNQLTFGEKIDSPTATRLPVLLAVALLKDRDGVLDLNLPISGSLDDPQFSVAGVIGRLLGNLLVKALTSPFALLTGGSGPSAAGEAGQVGFVAGTTRLDAAGLDAVERVAQALGGKPKLVLTVTGQADPDAERDAYRSAVLDERLEAAQRKRTVASAAAASARVPPLGTEARARLLKELYADSDLPDKPRNVLGFAKEVPVAEMASRLEAAIPVDADTMRELALQRGVSVRDALIARGLSSERLFLAAPQLRSEEAPAAWVPRAQLSLSLD